MISPKLIFQCSSASLLAAAVLASPMWAPSGVCQSDREVIGPDTAVERQHNERSTIEVEPVRVRHVLRSADSNQPKAEPRTRLQRTDSRTIEERNQAARKMMGELENSLEPQAGPNVQDAVQLQDLIDIHSHKVGCSGRYAKDKGSDIEIIRGRE